MDRAFIFNPNAGGGRSARKVLEPLLLAGKEHLLEATTAMEATDKSRGAAEDGMAVIAVGGDGTVNACARGVIESGSDSPFGLIPAGTGNDYNKVLGMSSRLEQALNQIRSGTEQMVDYGEISWEGGSHPFMNAAGCGFDAAAADASDAYKSLPGVTLGYLVAVLATLRGWDSPELVVSSEGKKLFAGKALLVEVANGTCLGGGFHLFPMASVQDGFLDLCVAKHMSGTRALRLIPKLMRGRLIEAPELVRDRVTEVTIESSVDVAIQADGEVLSRTSKTIRIRIISGGLKVIYPGPGEPV